MWVEVGTHLIDAYSIVLSLFLDGIQASKQLWLLFRRVKNVYTVYGCMLPGIEKKIMYNDLNNPIDQYIVNGQLVFPSVSFIDLNVVHLIWISENIIYIQYYVRSSVID